MTKQTRHNDSIERLDKQIALIEQVISELLDGFDFAKLSAKERMDALIKLMTQQGRLLAVGQAWDEDDPAEQSNEGMIELMRRMRDPHGLMDHDEDHDGAHMQDDRTCRV